MLRINQNVSAAGAKSYFSHADYYNEGQELVGIWRGKAAERLGVEGAIEKQDWDLLCDNRHPQTGAQLTPRTKADRRIGFDFNFNSPKSVSLVYGLTGDERIVEALRDAVGETMKEIEAEAKTRVRKRGKDEDRLTGNLVYGEFVHTTARPVDSLPDPALHAHCFVLNQTWDADEQRWKALQIGDIKRDAPYFEARFHARLASGMRKLGFEIVQRGKEWEIAGLDRATLRKFSRRTEQIEAEAHRLGITDPDKKGELGAKTRENKSKELTLRELRSIWQSRLNDEERSSIGRAIDDAEARGPIAPEPGSAAESVNFAVRHVFERSAVVPLRVLEAAAIRHNLGRCALDELGGGNTWPDIITGNRNGRICVTTREVLAEEQRMLAFARDGRGTCPALGSKDDAITRTWLSDEQQRAIRHVLTGTDRVMVIRGGAGTGKTDMMQEAVERIEQHGTRVFAFAPSADASRSTLRSKGFAEADTVARLLVDTQLQERIAGQVLWIDEAGLLGSRDMGRVFDLARERGARVVLSGDRRQHGSVARGAPLALLEDEAGIRPAELREIHRQSGKYKQAVNAIASGRIADGMSRLRELNWIRELPESERYRQLADDYVRSVSQGETALVVSPTHAEGRRITAEVRSRLKISGRIEAHERTFDQLEAVNLTEAERGERGSYLPGDVLEFHQNAKGAKRGERIVVGEVPLPIADPERFQVYRKRELSLAVGDRIRITHNGKTADGLHRLNNGAMYDVRGFSKTGDIVLSNGWTIGKGFGHLAYGYVTTSHSSQGKTVDRVFIGQSSASRGAASQEQFYVSVSRGRKQAVIYTDDAETLLDSVSHADDRATATDFVLGKRQRIAAIEPADRIRRESEKQIDREPVYER